MARPLKRDLTGKWFGRLFVIRKGPLAPGSAMWECRCECGNVVIVRGGALTGHNSSSCGCLRREFSGRTKTTHGLTGSPIYRVWNGMIQRCHNPNQPHYERYGGRGIYVCEEWKKSFAAFYKDMGDRPTGPTGKPYTIERKDNDGPYAPWNCEWVPHTAQSLNKRPRRKRAA